MVKKEEVLGKIKNNRERSPKGIKHFINRKRLIILTAILLVGFLVRNNLIKNSTLTIETTKAEKQDIIETISASGKVDAEKKSVLAFAGAGEVVEVAVKEGDYIQKNQLLARLDPTNLYQTYLQTQASLRSAEATRARVYDQVQGREKDESFTQRETRTAAEVAYDNAYRNYVVAAENLHNARMIAPFPGVVTDISDNMTEGVTVLATTGSITVVDPATVYFSAEINEVDVSKIHEGQTVELELDAYPNQVFEQTIFDISFNSKTTTTGATAYPIKITLPLNINNRFRLGMKGNAEIVLDKKDNVLSIPITAITEESDKQFLWVVENNKAKRIEIQTGLSSLDMAEIVSGVEENTIVILRPTKQVKEGLTIISK